MRQGLSKAGMVPSALVFFIWVTLAFSILNRGSLNGSYCFPQVFTASSINSRIWETDIPSGTLTVTLNCFTMGVEDSGSGGLCQEVNAASSRRQALDCNYL